MTITVGDFVLLSSLMFGFVVLITMRRADARARYLEEDDTQRRIDRIKDKIDENRVALERVTGELEEARRDARERIAEVRTVKPRARIHVSGGAVVRDVRIEGDGDVHVTTSKTTTTVNVKSRGGAIHIGSVTGPAKIVETEKRHKVVYDTKQLSESAWARQFYVDEEPRDFTSSSPLLNVVHLPLSSELVRRQMVEAAKRVEAQDAMKRRRVAAVRVDVPRDEHGRFVRKASPKPLAPGEGEYTEEELLAAEQEIEEELLKGNT